MNAHISPVGGTALADVDRLIDEIRMQERERAAEIVRDELERTLPQLGRKIAERITTHPRGLRRGV